MSGEAPHSETLESRKRRLIAQSELNRAQLFEEWRTLAHGAGHLAHRAKTIGAWTSAAALMVGGVAGPRRGPRVRGMEAGRFPRILNGVRLASAIWLAFRGWTTTKARFGSPEGAAAEFTD
jgi:hypothetical protein